MSSAARSRWSGNRGGAMNRMTRTFVRNLLLASALLLAAGPAWGEDQTGGAPGSWLSTYVSARSLGLGRAFVGAADDASSVVWNPAGLSTLVPNELHMDAARLFEDTTIGSFGFAIPGNKLPSFGLTVLTLRSGAFEKTDEMNNPLGTFNESETAYIFTMSRAFTPRLAVGVNSKLVRQSIEDFSGGGFGFDVGAIASITPSLKVGASALNLGGPNITLENTKETYATQFLGGFYASDKADPEVFSPTGENAVTNISLGSRTKGDTDNWSLSLLNKTDETVRKFGGKGTPPAHLMWDGKDENGMPLPDGTYRYQLVVHDSEGREILSQTRTVEISTGGPQGSVPV